MNVQIRPAVSADAEACGRIIYEAFSGIAGRHGFVPDFPSREAGAQLAQNFIAAPSVFAVVAEEDGRVIGSNFMSEVDAIRGIGPITVEPRAQGGGLGRRLMQAALDRANGAEGIRLLQDAFNMRSIALYASLGFEVREPVLVMSGRPSAAPPPAVTVRPMTEGYLKPSDALCKQVHGISRRADLETALRQTHPMVAVRAGRIVAYMTAPTFWIANHGVATSEADMQALILGAALANEEPLSFLLPTRQSRLFRWCLAQGMQALKPMTIMTVGKYHAPNGAYMPSVFY